MWFEPGSPGPIPDMCGGTGPCPFGPIIEEGPFDPTIEDGGIGPIGPVGMEPIELGGPGPGPFGPQGPGVDDPEFPAGLPTNAPPCGPDAGPHGTNCGGPPPPGV